jgi:hypothetical protein
MTYQRFKLPAQTVAKIASVAGAHAQTTKISDAASRAHANIHTAKFNNNININGLHTSEAVSSLEAGVVAGARTPATVAKVATVAELRGELAKFKQARPYGATRFRHDQACWAAEMFLNEWESLAAIFEWTVDDIFDPPHSNRSGLAYWLGVEIVTTLGPAHAVTEAGRVFDRITRATWINPYSMEARH